MIKNPFKAQIYKQIEKERREKRERRKIHSIGMHIGRM